MSTLLFTLGSFKLIIIEKFIQIFKEIYKKFEFNLIYVYIKLLAFAIIIGETIRSYWISAGCWLIHLYEILKNYILSNKYFIFFTPLLLSVYLLVKFVEDVILGSITRDYLTNMDISKIGYVYNNKIKT